MDPEYVIRFSSILYSLFNIQIPFWCPNRCTLYRKEQKNVNKRFLFYVENTLLHWRIQQSFFSLRTHLFKCILIRIFGTLWFFILELSKCVSTLYFSMRDKSFPYQLLNVFSDKSNKLFTGISCKKGQLGSIKFSFHWFISKHTITDLLIVYCFMYLAFLLTCNCIANKNNWIIFEDKKV